MESSTVTHPPRGPSVANESPRPSAGDSATNARYRGAVMARMLFLGDSLAACAAAAIAVFVLGLDPWGSIAYAACVTALWPLAAFSIGLYRTDQLATWASSVTEVPRAFVAILLITWPLYGIASGLPLEDVVTLTFLTVVGIAAFAPIARTVVRA